jgi:energy-coupling factor transporter ATP-binding protein EcfA2
LRRVALARALILEPPIVLADEPTNDLDPQLAKTVADCLFEARDSGAGVVIVTHDRALAARADRMYRWKEAGFLRMLRPRRADIKKILLHISGGVLMGKKVLGTLMAGMLAIAMLTVGCGGGDKAGAPKSKELRPVRVGYFGGTCEAPIYVAYENGIFKKHGLNVELVKVKASTTKEMVATGKVDALMASPGTFKPIEQGMNIKLTAGIHTGCIQAVVPVDSPVKSVADLKGRTIGVESMGGPPMIYLSMEAQNRHGPQERRRVRSIPVRS